MDKVLLMNCKICSHVTRKIFSSILMNKYKINYFYCNNCGFLSTEEPYWLDEVYANPISKFDTGHIIRNIRLADQMTTLLSIFFDAKGRFVDYAGGNGILVRIMRDIGFDYYWNDKYAQNLYSSRFEWDINSAKLEVEAVTIFESFEHFVEPMQELKQLLSISKNIIFTTELLPNPIPLPNEWWYYTLERGGHISFYSEKTLKYIATQNGLHYFHLNNLHIFTKKNNISNLKLKILKLNKLGLNKLLSRRLKSRTWKDYEYIRTSSIKKV